MDEKAPPPWWIWATRSTTVLVALVCGLVLWSFLPPVVYFVYFALAGWALMFLGALWLLFALIGWFKYRAARWTAVAPALVVVTAVLVVLSVPSKTAFAVSESSLTAAATDCESTPDDSWIGVYKVRRTQSTDSGCLFFLEGGLFDSIGLAYMPDGPPNLGEPTRDGDIGYEEFDGDWYQFIQRFGRSPPPGQLELTDS